MPRGAKVIMMLDIVQTIYQKVKNIDEGQITIAMDNKAMWRIANRIIEIANHFNQEAVAEGAAIQRLIEESLINVRMDKVYP